ncbi:glycosyltransferase family 2 protein [Candidatus Accumulibacter aalborgensis]|uniref:glycosyltransferase family 2 protein n=1 Tax=Candidatus Accumulibacter aalborgensis TaxID=1860102 RepID=UPI001FE19E89|nr:glycosyltransferase family 2 protein [Candidatus Accumulibacter aalborgensis]
MNPTALSGARAGGEYELPTVSCIVPALNECANLQVLLPSLEAILKSHSSDWEIIVVDDGSTDATADLMASWAARHGFRYLQLSRNFGKEAALSAGLEAADGQVVICLDADLQHPPALIPQMLERWRAGADVVCAVRVNRDDESRVKRYGASLLYAILGSGNRLQILPDAGDFRLMDRKVVAALIQLPERTRFMKGLYAWVGFRTETIEYLPPERLHGASRFDFIALVQFAVDGITAFSTWPLRLLSFIGFIVALLAFAYGAYLVVEYMLIGNQVSGWTTIVTTMLFLSGVHLLGLGVIGAYLSRVFDEVKQRPLYVLKNDVGTGLKKALPDSEQP